MKKLICLSLMVCFFLAFIGCSTAPGGVTNIKLEDGSGRSIEGGCSPKMETVMDKDQVAHQVRVPCIEICGGKSSGGQAVSVERRMKTPECSGAKESNLIFERQPYFNPVLSYPLTL